MIITIIIKNNNELPWPEISVSAELINERCSTTIDRIFYVVVLAKNVWSSKTE